MLAVERSVSDAICGQRWLDARLEAKDRACLGKQGFVHISRLPSGKSCGKLRYRNASGRQCVIYLGVDLRLATQVSAALDELQRSRRRRRAARLAIKRGWKALRTTKAGLEPLLRANGWHLHGLTPRRRKVTSDIGTGGLNIFSIIGVMSMTDEPGEVATDDATRDHDPRAQIYDNMLRAAVQQSDPRQAAVDFAAAMLLDVTTLIIAPIQTSLRTADDPLQCIDDLTPALEMSLKTGRQAERFLSILKQVQPPASANKSTIDTYVDPGSTIALGLGNPGKALT